MLSQKNTSYKREPSLGWKNIEVQDISGQINYNLLKKDSKFSHIILNGYISEDCFEITFKNVKDMASFDKFLNVCGYEIDPIEKLMQCCMIKVPRAKIPGLLKEIAKHQFISEDLLTDILISINETKETLENIRRELNEKRAYLARRELEIKKILDIDNAQKAKNEQEMESARKQREKQKNKLLAIAHALLKDINNLTAIANLSEQEKKELPSVFNQLLKYYAPLQAVSSTEKTKNHYLAEIEKFKKVEQLLISLKIPDKSFSDKIKYCEEEINKRAFPLAKIKPF